MCRDRSAYYVDRRAAFRERRVWVDGDDPVAVAADASNDQIEALALAEPNVQRFIEDKDVKKVIVVPGRLVNVVVK